MPIPATAAAVHRTLAREDVYRTIKQWIVALQLAPDELIRDQDIAERLGVSRTPVREALRRLEDEGLVVTRFHKWTKVAPAAMAEAAQLYPVVAALEASAVELALPHLTAADLARLAALNAALALAIDGADVAPSALLDRAFHALLVRRSGNQELARLLATLLPRIERIELAHFGNQPVARQSVREHAAIIDALQLGDGASAAAIMKKNWLW
ncbi:DNA-binding GntR family transcriptional regulator [Janthinobacterium sp. CG_23.3]|uniref:GntR family transcriptional regulator n=1 Tax=Janthinobacterium sp. CG_23.3 TaxID=3349634 RepID=UPI0038D40659